MKISLSYRLVIFAISLIVCLSGTDMANASATIPTLQLDSTHSVNNALTYFHGIQNADGGFPARAGSNSSRVTSDWVIIALAAAGEDLDDSIWAPNGINPLGYLQTSEPVMETTTDYARTLLTLSAANLGRHVNGVDLSSKLASFQLESGQFGQPGEEGLINAHMWSILALKSAGWEIPDGEKARTWLLARQNQDGGFAWMEGVDSDADDTAVAIQTMVTLGELTTNPSIQKALLYLKSCQTESGGFSSGWVAGRYSNLNTDAWVIQGLAAAGENPLAPEWSVNTNTVLSDIKSLQNIDGSFFWMQDILSCQVTNTSYAVIALTGKPYPIIGGK